MGYKKKWKDNSYENLLKYLNKVNEIINPLFENNGTIDLSNLDRKSDLEYLLALILNCKFVSNEDKNIRSFGADDVIVLQLEVENNELLKYWGKINWLSKPNEHECHKSYQDPFFALFKLDNNDIEIVEAMFGDYDKNDLDGQYWIESDMDWKYDI